MHMFESVKILQVNFGTLYIHIADSQGGLHQLHLNRHLVNYHLTLSAI